MPADLVGATEEEAERRDFAATLARGLAVLRAFDAGRERMTAAEVAKLVDLPRATVRRSLLTLAALGYVETDGKCFSPTPQVLLLAQSYLASASLPRVAQPYLERLSDQLYESCSLSVLHGRDVIYVARSSRKRMASLHRDVGTHLPAWCTSMGRVLLAELPEGERNSLLAEQGFEPLTPHTLRGLAALERELMLVSAQGWCLVDQEMEVGLVSLAVPVRNARGRVVAALNVSTQAGRRTADDMLRFYLPALQGTAAALRPLLV